MTEDDLLDEVLAQFARSSVLELGEFSVAQYAERKGLTSYEARSVITQAFRAGKLTRRRGRWEGDAIWIYRLAPGS